MSRRLVLVLVLLGLVTIVATAWRLLLRPVAQTPLEFPCLDSPAAGWLTAQSERSLLRLEWDGDGGGRVGIAPAGESLVVWSPISEVEARKKARMVIEPLRTSVSSDAFDQVSVLVACDTNLTPWSGETTEVLGYRACLDWPLAQIGSCLAEVCKERRTVVDWRAGAVGERIDSESQKRGLKLRPREPTIPSFRGPWALRPSESEVFSRSYGLSISAQPLRRVHDSAMNALATQGLAAMTAITAPVASSSRFSAPVVARHVARVVLGGLFTFASAMYFLGPAPTELPPGNAGIFAAGLAAAGYLMPLLKSIELVCGLALLSNRFVPLALVVLAPITINIFAVHATLMPAGLPIAIVLVVSQLALAWAHRSAFAALFIAKAK